MLRATPATEAAPKRVAAGRQTVLAYHPGEHPAWKEVDDPNFQQAPAKPIAPTNMPLALMVHETPSDTSHEVWRRIGRLDRNELIRRFRIAYANGKRLVAFAMASELIERGMPPCFWHESLALDSATLGQREILVLVDLAWLRRWHRDHASVVRYQRGKALLTGSETVFLREAKFAFYKGNRPAWKIVGSMSMTERQQWESAYLRSTPIKKQAEATATFSQRVYQALHDDLRTARRTVTFGDTEAAATLTRRHAIWHCSRMVKGGSPTEIAIRYLQLTGTSLTRQTVAKQLEKVAAVLRETKSADTATT